MKMRRTLTLMLLFIPCFLAKGSYESHSEPFIFDVGISRYPVAFSYPAPYLSHQRRFISYHFLNHESLPCAIHESLPSGLRGKPLAKFRGRFAANMHFLSLQCQKSNSDLKESSNKTSSKIPSWETGLKQRMEGLDFSLMKNDLSLISIYSLGDSIIEVSTKSKAVPKYIYIYIYIHIAA